MLLDKVIYRRIEDGNYTLVPSDWEIKSTKGDTPQEYVSLKCTIPELNDRPIDVALFEKGLEITCSNVIRHFDLEEQSILDILAFMLNKPLPAYHETKNDAEADRTYYNWFICNEDR